MSPSISIIKRHVASVFGVTVAEIDGPRRAREVVLPRHIAIYLAKQLTSCSLPHIGRQFGDRDHSTIMHAIKQMEGLIAHDSWLAAKAAEIKASMPATDEAGEETVNLDVIARKARRQAVRIAKTYPGSLVRGRPNDLRAALKYLYQEAPVAMGKSLTGGIVDLLVSDTGTWSIIETGGGLSTLIASGISWTKGSPS